MSVGELPPAPDASGQPRPPAAPRVVGPWDGGRHELKIGHHEVADRVYVASSGQGPPLLESARAGRPPGRWVSAARDAAYTVLPIALVGAIALWFIVEDRAQGYLFLAVAVGVTGALFFWRNAADTTVVLLAGARAVAEVDTDGDGLDLPLYELRAIGVTDSRRGLSLRLVGPGGHRLTLPFGLLEANQELWDLVYNGIRHSEAAGAEVDARTRELLALPPMEGRG